MNQPNLMKLLYQPIRPIRRRGRSPTTSRNGLLIDAGLVLAAIVAIVVIVALATCSEYPPVVTAAPMPRPAVAIPDTSPSPVIHFALPDPRLGTNLLTGRQYEWPDHFDRVPMKSPTF